MDRIEAVVVVFVPIYNSVERERKRKNEERNKRGELLINECSVVSQHKSNIHNTFLEEKRCRGMCN